MILDDETTKEKIEKADMVISMGGDGTFLKTANHIHSPDMPLIGINTDPGRSVGCLCSTSLRKPEIDAPKIVHRLLDTQDYKVLNRARISMFVNGKEKKNYLALNEVFLGENERGQLAAYSFDVDKTVKGRVKSSGIIVSTGTGSSGWLSSAKRISVVTMKQLLVLLGKDSEIDAREMQEEIATGIIFDPEMEKMYYMNREVNSGTKDETRCEGFCELFEYRNECVNG